LLLLAPGLFCENFFSMTFHDQIDWQIEKGYLPEAIKFIEDWLRANTLSYFPTKILFTKYEDLVANPVELFNTILDFYGIDKSNFAYPDHPEKEKNSLLLNYRKGMIDEWREVFTPEQAERASSMIPHRLLDRFGWPEH